MSASLACVDNGRLKLGDYPSDPLIHRLADTSEANEEELLILAKSTVNRMLCQLALDPISDPGFICPVS